MGPRFGFGFWTSGTQNQQLGFEPRQAGWDGPEVTQCYQFCGCQIKGSINSHEVFIAEHSSSRRAAWGHGTTAMLVPCPPSPLGASPEKLDPSPGPHSPHPRNPYPTRRPPRDWECDPCHTCVCAGASLCGYARAEERLWPGIVLWVRRCFKGVCLPPQRPAGPKSRHSHPLCLKLDREEQG